MTVIQLAKQRPMRPAPLLHSVEALRERVAELRDSTESAFLRAGQRLVATNDLLAQVLEPVTAITDLSRSQTLPLLRQAAQSHAEELAQVMAALKAGTESLLKLEGLRIAIEADMSGLRRVIRTMTIVVLNARITAATVPGATDSLATFTEDATALVANAADLLTTFEDTIQRIRHRGESAQDSANQILIAVDTGLSQGLRSFLMNVDRFQDHVLGLAASGNHVSDEISALLELTARAVAALQIGDNTRQRLDHMVEALEYSDESNRLAIHALVTAQLTDTIAVHDSEFGSLNQATEALETRILRFVDTQLSAFAQTRASVDLTHSAGQIEAMTTEGLAAQSRLLEFAESLRSELSMLDELALAGDAFEAKMRLIGINAVIACSALGDRGRALKEVSGQLQELAAEVADRFPVIRRNLSDMAATSVAAAEHLSRASEITRALPAGSARDIRLRITEVSSLLDQATRLTEAARQTFRGADAAYTALGVHREELMRLIPSLEPVTATPEHIAQAHAVLDRIFDRYTMERERDVHRHVDPEASAALPEDAAIATNDIDSIFF